MSNEYHIERYISKQQQIAISNPNPVRSFKLAASVLYRRMPISVGVNSYKTDPFMLNYGKNEHSIYLHAEVSAIKTALRILNVDDLSSCTLVVARVKRKGPQEEYVSALAKPCSGCLRCIAEFGIKNVWYTTTSGVEQL